METNIFEKYLLLHDKIMEKVANDEITTEQAKELNDLAFNKYVIESSYNEDELDNNELEIFEESARHKYVEQLEKEKARLEKLLEFARGERLQSIKTKLKDIDEKLFKYGTGAKTGGYNNPDASVYVKDDKTGKVSGYKLRGTTDGGNSFYHDTVPTPGRYVGGKTAAETFAKDFGSKEPKESELHDNINKRTETRKNK